MKIQSKDIKAVYDSVQDKPEYRTWTNVVTHVERVVRGIANTQLFRAYPTIQDHRVRTLQYET